MPNSPSGKKPMTGAFEEAIAGLFGGDSGGGGDWVEELAQQILAGTGVETRTPIGVPDGYLAPPKKYNTQGMSPRAIEGSVEDGRGGGWNQRTAGWAPLYFDGDQYMPGTLDPGKIAELQADLAAIGLLKPGYRKNVWDAESADAYAQLLAYANQNGLTREQALAKYQAGEGGLDGEGDPYGERDPYGPLIVKEPNRMDVEQTMREAYLNLTGQGGNPQAIQAATEAYIQAVRAPQEQAYEMEKAAYEAGQMGGVSAGGTVTEAPSPTAFATDWVQKNDPQGVATESGLAYIKDIMTNIQGWG